MKYLILFISTLIINVQANDLKFDTSTIAFIYDQRENPDISLCLDQEYKFTRISQGHPLRIVKDRDCTTCKDGTYANEASTVSSWKDVAWNSEQNPVNFTFNEAGTYYYVCTSTGITHNNMVGKITVSDGAGCDQADKSVSSFTIENTEYPVIDYDECIEAATVLEWPGAVVTTSIYAKIGCYKGVSAPNPIFNPTVPTVPSNEDGYVSVYELFNYQWRENSCSKRYQYATNPNVGGSGVTSQFGYCCDKLLRGNSYAFGYKWQIVTDLGSQTLDDFNCFTHVGPPAPEQAFKRCLDLPCFAPIINGATYTVINDVGVQELSIIEGELVSFDCTNIHVGDTVEIGKQLDEKTNVGLSFDSGIGIMQEKSNQKWFESKVCKGLQCKDFECTTGTCFDGIKNNREDNIDCNFQCFWLNKCMCPNMQTDCGTQLEVNCKYNCKWENGSCRDKTELECEEISDGLCPICGIFTCPDTVIGCSNSQCYCNGPICTKDEYQCAVVGQTCDTATWTTKCEEIKGGIMKNSMYLPEQCVSAQCTFGECCTRILDCGNIVDNKNKWNKICFRGGGTLKPNSPACDGICTFEKCCNVQYKYYEYEMETKLETCLSFMFESDRGVCGDPCTTFRDDCGVCDGPGIPQGDCDCNGNVLDKCRKCGGDGIPAGKCDCGGNVLDNCDVCGGDDSSCAGCNGIPNSGLIVDVCGYCGGTGIKLDECDCEGTKVFDGDRCGCSRGGIEPVCEQTYCTCSYYEWMLKESCPNLLYCAGITGESECNIRPNCSWEDGECNNGILMKAKKCGCLSFCGYKRLKSLFELLEQPVEGSVEPFYISIHGQNKLLSDLQEYVEMDLFKLNIAGYDMINSATNINNFWIPFLDNCEFRINSDKQHELYQSGKLVWDGKSDQIKLWNDDTLWGTFLIVEPFTGTRWDNIM